VVFLVYGSGKKHICLFAKSEGICSILSKKTEKVYKSFQICCPTRIATMGVNDTKFNTLITAAHDLAEITSHMNKIVDINFQCKARPTALHTAVFHNNVAVAALLLERGADMMIAPLKKCVKNESECTLLMAFKQSDSHEDMQLLLLRHLSDFSLDKMDAVVLKKIVRVAQCALLYSSKRVFFAAEELKMRMVVGEPSGFNPLMFTIMQVGLFEDDVAKCGKILDHVLEIVNEDSAMLWHRYYLPSANKKRKLPLYTGGTALGMLLFHIGADRQKRCTEYAGYLEGVARGKIRMAQYMPSTDPHAAGLALSMIQRNAELKEIHERNLELMAYFAKDFAPRLFAKMLPSMRVALGMSTHVRLGNQHNCAIAQLNSDLMNMIFNQLVNGITTAPEKYIHMLY